MRPSESTIDFWFCVILVLITTAIGVGIEWYVYDTGHLKDHMTFLEWLMIRR